MTRKHSINFLAIVHLCFIYKIRRIRRLQQKFIVISRQSIPLDATSIVNTKLRTNMAAVVKLSRSISKSIIAVSNHSTRALSCSLVYKDHHHLPADTVTHTGQVCRDLDFLQQSAELSFRPSQDAVRFMFIWYSFRSK